MVFKCARLEYFNIFHYAPILASPGFVYSWAFWGQQ